MTCVNLKCQKAPFFNPALFLHGHAQIETTLNHYTHKVDADDKQAAKTIGVMLSPTVETAIMQGNFGP